MRFLFIIMCLIATKGLTQVAAPDLRCLEVLPGGDVKLTWVPPTDPGHQFLAYEIYSSVLAGGPFALVTGSINSIATNTFIHTNASGTVQSRYYYMRTLYGSSGSNSSGNSDTVRSIFLSILNPSGAPDLKLSYNNLHSPKLPSSASAFAVSKEFPAATWNVLATTSSLNYSDTNNLCNASLHYQVSLADFSGCMSLSNIAGGVYGDNKLPNEPFIDSVSVLPNGNTVIAWRIPYDKDIVKYKIQYINSGGSRDTLGYVKGRNNTLYTYTTTLATKGPVSLYVGAVDSCNNPSTFNYTISNSIFVEAKYNRCEYKTELNWTNYTFQANGLLHYKIYYSVDGGPFTPVGTTTLTSFTHLKADPDRNLCYFIRAVNRGQTMTASSNRTCLFSSQVRSPAYVYIKSASVVNNNSVFLDLLLDTSEYCTGFNVLRSADGASFSPIGFVNAVKNPHYTFTDNSVQPLSRSYYYKLVVVDSCGNSRAESPVAKTILLKVMNEGQDLFTRRLSWSDYEGFAGGLVAYRIYRVINGVTESPPVASTHSTTTEFTDNLEDEAPNGAAIEYFIKAVEGGNNPYGVTAESNSNAVRVYADGQIFVPNAFAPNGNNRSWLPVTHFIDKSEYHVSIFDRWGRLRFETRSDTEAWDGGGQPSDLYVYLISYKNALGEYKEIKGTVLLIR